MYSGEEAKEDSNSANFRRMFPGKFHSAIREFQGFFYNPDFSATPGVTNEHQFMVDALFHPFNNKDLTLFVRYLQFFFYEPPIVGRGEHICQEVDVKLGYSYTEDLKFNLIGAVFAPGDYFSDVQGNIAIFNQFGELVTNASEAAKEVVGEVVLTF